MQLCRKYLPLFVTLFLAICLIGALTCYAGGEEEEGKKVEITIWQHSYPPLNEWTKGHIADFMEIHPNIMVSYELIPFEEWNQKIFTALATGQGPHFFESDDYTFAQFIENDQLGVIDPALFGFDSVAGLTGDYEGKSLDLVTFDGKLYGPACKASFVLAKTEDTRWEKPVEEDDWVAGLEWADSIGAEVASSSLAYMTWDTGGGYTYEDMDGNTAVTTQAADMAASRGIVVCNAMGNEGPSYRTLDAPADADIPGKVDRRRHRLLRLLREASEQAAAPAVKHLAQALGVGERTIRRDLAALRAQGHDVRTRGARSL